MLLFDGFTIRKVPCIIDGVDWMQDVKLHVGITDTVTLTISDGFYIAVMIRE